MNLPKFDIQFNYEDLELLFILGRPNFSVARVAHRLRDKGLEIPTKAEDEQAAALYLMLHFYNLYGTGDPESKVDSWFDKLNAWLSSESTEVPE